MSASEITNHETGIAGSNRRGQMKSMKALTAAALLAASTGTASAGINDLIIEYYQGDLDIETALASNTESESGKGRGLSITFPTTETAYLRADYLQEEYTAMVGPGTMEGFGTVVSGSIDRSREVRSLVIGMVDMANAEMRIFADIGAAKIRRSRNDTGSNGTGVFVSELETETTSPMVRLGLTGEDGRFAWYLTGEYLHDALQADFTEDSEIWKHLYVGYQLTENVELGVRYSDTVEFKTLGGSARVRF